MFWILLAACRSEKDCEVAIIDDSGVITDTTDSDDTGSSETGVVELIDEDGDGALFGFDCDDTNPLVYPGAPETCDGVDNNCSGDENDAEDALVFYADTDNDGFGDQNNPTNSCSQPSGYVDNMDDCDDSSEDINPDMEDICDGIDNNCSGDESDGTDPQTWYMDNDSDGFGDIAVTTESCDQPSDYVSNDTDCDDTNDMVNPDAIEICNDSIDSDCDTNLDRAVCSWSESDMSLNLELNGAFLFTTGGIGGDYDNDGTNETYWVMREFDSSFQLVSSQFCILDPLSITTDSFTPSDCTGGFTTTDDNWMNLSFPVPSHNKSRDVNGDGADDLLLGSNRYNGAGVGAIAIITDPVDSTFNLSSPMTVIENPHTDGSYGSLIAYAGDINDDGIGDIITAAPFSSFAAPDAGAVYLIYGSSDLSTSQTLTIVGEANDRLGRSITTGDDINGDGIDDLVLSAYRDSYVDGNGQITPSSGAGYVFYGPLTQDMSSADADQIIYGSEEADQLGYSLDTTTDYDGDGLADILLGSHYPNRFGLSQVGMAVVVTDSTSPVVFSNDAYFQMYGQTDIERMGRNVMSLGDLNNDGFDDIAISAKETDYIETNGGSLHIFYGPTMGTVTPENANAIISGSTDSQFSINLNTSPDIDGDGTEELIVGSYHYTSNGPIISSGIIWGGEL